MKQLTSFLSLLYNSTFLPIHLFRADGTTEAYPHRQLPQNFFHTYEPLLVQQKKEVSYITTKNLLYIGMIQNKETKDRFFFGPVSSTAVTDSAVTGILNESCISAEYRSAFQEYFHTTPSFTLYQFLNILALATCEILHIEIDVYEYFHFMNPARTIQISHHAAEALYERKEQGSYHNTYLYEKEYLGYVQNGDVEALKKTFQNVPAFTVGNLSGNSIRQEKNLFITCITSVTRYSISGGLDIETAYQLSDSYIQEVEKLSDPAEIELLNLTAILDFATRVRESKIPVDMSPVIYRALQYIGNHTNQLISVADVADELHLNRSTLSKKFKQELGFNISDYIMRRKLEEAKSLLHFTDKTISEISEYLCFSTQSYFQNVFKKKYGMTPKEFRNQVKL